MPLPSPRQSPNMPPALHFDTRVEVSIGAPPDVVELTVPARITRTGAELSGIALRNALRYADGKGVDLTVVRLSGLALGAAGESGTPQSHSIYGGLIKVDAASRTVRVDGGPVKLTSMEFDILKCLAEVPGTVLTHTQILRRIRSGHLVDSDAHALVVQVSRLRRALGTPEAIVTHRSNRGYGGTSLSGYAAAE